VCDVRPGRRLRRPAAYDPARDREVALKLIRTDHADAPASARLQREARVVPRLSHPNVIHWATYAR